MKNYFLLAICSLFISVCYSQEKIPCDSTRLQTNNLINTDDPCLIAGVDYVLTRPLYGNPERYNQYLRFILAWMEKTPDFTFTLNNKIIALCKDENLSLFNVYLSCLTKAAILDKKANSGTAVKLFADYLKKTDNKVKQTPKIKKLIREVEEGQMEKYL